MSNIVLIGFMASGKTTVGNRLASVSGYKLVDTDEEIVKKEGRSINDIFATDGEPYFRKLETSMIEEMADKLDNCIISTGGGLAITPGNDEKLRKLGKVVYLKVTPETVLKRISGDSSRPLLAGDAKSKTLNLLAYRQPIYDQCADIAIDTDDKSVDMIVDMIMRNI